MSAPFAFMIKTLLRPHCLEPLLKSLRYFYPDAPVWIADDSPEPYPEVAESFGEVSVHHVRGDGTSAAETSRGEGGQIVYATFPYDIGIGTCYNWMIDRIPTPYIVLLDDDFVFTKKTKVEKFIPLLRSGYYDLVGGEVYNRKKDLHQGFCGHFTEPGIRILDHSTIHLRKVPRGRISGPVSVEITMNFFMAKTEVLRAVRWNPELKVCRHEDFFLRFSGYKPHGQPREEGYRAAFWRGVEVEHAHQSGKPAPDQKHNYAYHRRDRFPQFRKKFIEHWSWEFV